MCIMRVNKITLFRITFLKLDRKSMVNYAKFSETKNTKIM